MRDNRFNWFCKSFNGFDIGIRDFVFKLRYTHRAIFIHSNYLIWSAYWLLQKCWLRMLCSKEEMNNFKTNEKKKCCHTPVEWCIVPIKWCANVQKPLGICKLRCSDVCAPNHLFFYVKMTTFTSHELKINTP